MVDATGDSKSVDGVWSNFEARSACIVGAGSTIDDAATGHAAIALTIGVTGHRHLDASAIDSYRRRIETFFDDLQSRCPHTPLRVLSPLAEGADRLPVEIALARGYQVFAVLPLGIDDYERDFADRASLFHDLLARIPAHHVIVLPPIPVEDSFIPPEDDAHRDRHYQQAGDFIASHCHVLLALWDGVDNALPGGTGEVVRYKLTGRGPHRPSVTELLELPDGGPVAWLSVRRDGTGVAESGASASGTLRWLYPKDRGAEHFEGIHRQIDTFNRLARRRPSSTSHGLGRVAALGLGPTQADTVRLFNAADDLSIHYRKIGDRVLKVLIALGIVMTVAYESYSRLLPIRAMLGLYLGAFALVCVVYVWHRKLGALEKHLDYRALAEGLRVRIFWSLAGIRTPVNTIYLRKQNDELQWIREALRPHRPMDAHGLVDADLVQEAWLVDQVRYFDASARRLDRTGRWAKLASLAFFGLGLIKTAALFVFWNHLGGLGELGHWTIITVGSLPVVGALIDSLSDSMGYSARSKQHAILAGVFDRAADAYVSLREREGDQVAGQKMLLEGLGREALFENEDWLTLRRDRPMTLPPRRAQA